jgi:hypothetical protein
VLHDLLYKLV